MRSELINHRLCTMAMISLLFSGWAPKSAKPCTTFLFSDGKRHLVGKSYDYDIGYGHVVFNKKGVSKTALVTAEGARSASWISRYASLTFNQFGREFPQGGINENGLVVEIMWLEESRYPDIDGRQAVNELQWIQFHLDTAVNVREMMKNASKLTVLTAYGKVHYLACDRTGLCAAFEYLDGKLVITPPERMKANTLTNHTYADSVAYLVKHQGFGGNQTTPAGTGSLQRFVRASVLARRSSRKTKDRVVQAFTILDKVSMGDYTKWNLVYDLNQMQVHFRTRGGWRIKVVNLNAFDRSCKTPVRVLDMNTNCSGNVTKRFSKYDAKKNKILVRKSLSGIQANLPPTVTEAIANLPESYRCTLRDK